MKPVIEAAGPFLEEKQKAAAIGICRKDTLSAIAVQDEVIKPPAGWMRALRTMRH